MPFLSGEILLQSGFGYTRMMQVIRLHENRYVRVFPVNRLD